MPDAGYTPKTTLELLQRSIEEFRAYPPHSPFAGPLSLILQELTDLRGAIEPMTNERKARIGTLVREIVREEFARLGTPLTACQLNKIVEKLLLALLS